MKNKALLIWLTALLFISCGEIIEPNIEGRKVFLLAPSDSIKTSVYTQLFSWEPVEGARSYRLQIAEPGFGSIRNLVADTVLTARQFRISLYPGKFEWRVRAENGGYVSLYSTNRLEVMPSSIKQQKVNAVSPDFNALSNQTTITFKWDAMYGAKRYQLQVDTNSFADEQKLVIKQDLTSTQFTTTILKDQNCQWRVRAVNDTAQSLWSDTRFFTLDRKAPAQVGLASPANNTSLSKPLTLSWNGLSDAFEYQVYVYQPDSTTLLSGFPETVSSTSIVFNTGEINDRYVWRVRARDKAGNQGTFSEYRSFTLQ